MAHRPTRLPFPVSAGLVACLAFSTIYLAACNRSQTVSSDPLPILDTGAAPRCLQHLEIVPDLNNRKVAELRVHEHDCYADIDAFSLAGNLAEALGACHKLLAEQEECLGKDNCDCFLTWKKIADLSAQLNKQDECLTAMQKMIDIRMKYLGPDCVDTAAAIKNALTPMIGYGRLSEAAAMVQHYQDLAFRGHPSICCQIAYLYADAYLQDAQGQYGQACATVQKALDMKKTVPQLSTVAPKPYAFLLVGARAAMKNNRLDQAYGFLSDAVHLRFGKHEMEDPQFVELLLAIAQTWKSQHNLKGEENCLRMAVEISATDPTMPGNAGMASWQAMRSFLTESGRAAEIPALDASMMQIAPH